MKKLYILTLLICLTGFGNSFAQTLKGHIYDANTNEPLVGAAVTYKLHGNQGTVSDINGAYEIKLPEGGVDLVFSYIGYEDVLMPIVIGRREVITKDVYMKESTKLLEEVVVSAGRFEQKLSNVTVSMDLVKAGDIARFHQVHGYGDITELLLKASGAYHYLFQQLGTFFHVHVFSDHFTSADNNGHQNVFVTDVAEYKIDASLRKFDFIRSVYIGHGSLIAVQFIRYCGANQRFIGIGVIYMPFQRLGKTIPESGKAD